MSFDSPVPQPAAPDQHGSFFDETVVDSWSSAFEKANNAGRLSFDDVSRALIDDAAIGGKTFSRDERIALKHMKDNFDDVARLDLERLDPAIDKSDINMFTDLYRNTARDVAFYDRGVNFMVQNKSKLDTDNDGVLTLKEIQAAKTNPSYLASEIPILDYLSDRYSNRLRYTHSAVDLSVSNASVPEADYKPGAMKKIIDRNQAAVFEREIQDQYGGVLSWIGPTLGTAAGAYFARFRFLEGAALTVAAAIGSKIAFGPYAHWYAGMEQTVQEEKVHRLMTTVGKLNY